MKRLLLDENLPKQLTAYFSFDFEVTSVPDLGWQSKKNGELLSAMEAEGLTYLLTADRNLRFQQNLEKYSVIVVVMITFDNRLKNLMRSMSKIEAEIIAADPAEKIIQVDLRR